VSDSAEIVREVLAVVRGALLTARVVTCCCPCQVCLKLVVDVELLRVHASLAAESMRGVGAEVLHERSSQVLSQQGVVDSATFTGVSATFTVATAPECAHFPELQAAIAASCVQSSKLRMIFFSISSEQPQSDEPPASQPATNS